MLTILEAATLAGVSKDKCRYWLKLLDLEMIKQNGKLLLPGNAVDILQAMKKAVDSGLAPVAAAQDVKNIHALPTVQEFHQDAPGKNDIVLEKLEALERSVLFLAQTVEKQNQVIADQSKQINTLSIRLLPPPRESAPVQVWQPTEKKAPQVSWLKRAWLELTNPVRLRASP